MKEGEIMKKTTTPTVKHVTHPKTTPVTHLTPHPATKNPAKTTTHTTWTKNVSEIQSGNK